MARQRTEAAGYRKILLRIPEALLTRVQAAARLEDRSVNSQLLQYIRQGIKATDHHPRAQGTAAPDPFDYIDDDEE